jgi:hypothetical protein
MEVLSGLVIGIAALVLLRIVRTRRLANIRQ